MSLKYNNSVLQGRFFLSHITFFLIKENTGSNIFLFWVTSQQKLLRQNLWWLSFSWRWNNFNLEVSANMGAGAYYFQIQFERLRTFWLLTLCFFYTIYLDWSKTDRSSQLKLVLCCICFRHYYSHRPSKYCSVIA